MFERAKRITLTEEVYRQLMERIVDGALPPGSALPSERALTEKLGVSRTAVREALQRLEHGGLVATRHGGESRVLDYRQSAGLDLLPELIADGEGRLRPGPARAAIEMREALAPDIARRCARRATPAIDAELDEITAEMEAVGDDALSDLQRLSARFWDALARGSENVAYQLAMNSLREVLAEVREPVAAAQAGELRHIEGYRAIASAVARRAEAEAADAAEAHVSTGVGPLLALVDAREGAGPPASPAREGSGS